MTDREALRVTLWAAIEDYAGLWEMPWELRGAWGDADARDVMREAQRAVRELLDRGWAELYSCQEPYGEVERLPLNVIDQVLSDDANWTAPELDGLSVRVSATAEGEAAYRNM